MIFNSIIVNNFRGIKSAKIEDFRRVNVFFGKNNCGKSTLLEALFMICGQSSPLMPISVNGFRGLGRLTEEDLGWIFYNMNTKTPVHIETAGDAPRHMDISVFRRNNATVDLTNPNEILADNSSSYYGYAIDFDGGLRSEVIVEKGNLVNTKINVNPDYTEKITAIYSTPRVPNIEQYIDVLKALLTNKSTDFLVRMLRYIEPKVQTISLVGDMIMIDLGGEKLLPILMMGDGVLRIMSIVLSIYKCTDGVLIIDEVDNGLHYSVMKHLWTALFAASEVCNVQLYVSTHNIDSLRALANFVVTQDDDYKQMLSAYKLAHTDSDEIKGLRYDADTLSYMINQEIEIR